MVVEKLHPMCLSSEVDFVTGPEISADHCRSELKVDRGMMVRKA